MTLSFQLVSEMAVGGRAPAPDAAEAAPAPAPAPAPSAPAPAAAAARAPKKRGRPPKRAAPPSPGQESSEDDSDVEEDFGANHAGHPIFQVDEIVDERGEGDDKEFQAFWKPRETFPEPSWHHWTNFLPGSERAVKAFREKRAKGQ